MKIDIFPKSLRPFRWTQNIARCQNVPKNAGTAYNVYLGIITQVPTNEGEETQMGPDCRKLLRF